MQQGDGSEAQVTWEDQQNINRFGRLNNRFHELEDEIKLAKNNIGAIDGTHIPVVVERSKQAPLRCRKGFTSQNMMAAVSFDLNFLFVCTRWEGSAAGMRVLRWACEIGGFVVPEGKYYLVDSGYANTEKFLAPYRGERYHISQFDASTRAHVHRNSRDLYNHRHAQLRNVVERTFGILKKRFKILNVATPFSYSMLDCYGMLYNT
ncbi:uncharacterized protein LOC109709015 isoform X2 [Ananas comosus]|uniref:Uncharacterized protein LOC109709015 isoform X2 n=1 Tax=Ananas comosus TaxID=4615 RepID=A0A6P5ESD7_ANACO|nr:uncharacterized protein LOC109709015 isoform X2 [Ananas comosus]